MSRGLPAPPLPLLLLALGGCDQVYQVNDLHPSAGPPAVVASATKECQDCATLPLEFVTLPGTDHLLLLVTVASSPMGNGSAPAVSAATYGGQPLTFVERAAVTVGASLPLVEHWVLEDPPPGAATLEVTTPSQATLVVGVVEIERARGSAPIRMSAGASGSLSKQASLTLPSATSDLVIDSVCGGNAVDAPAAGQSIIFVDNFTTSVACGNLGVSAIDGAPSVPLGWGVNAGTEDYWIELASSVMPAT